MKRVLLFSSPRSGSTLFANIIRSHPNVEFYNEVFTRAPYVLPSFEAAFHANDSQLRQVFESDLNHLGKYKLPWRQNFVHRHKRVKFITFLVVKLGASIGSRVLPAHLQWNYFQKSYHVNSLHEPPLKPFWQTQFVKKARPGVLFFKDVRIRKAYYAFRTMYPDAYFIYLIRNPYFVVASTLRQRQITHASRTLMDQAYLRDAFRRPDLVGEFFGKNVEQNFALQWVLENEMVTEDLLCDPPEHLLQIRFEDIVADLKGTAREVFSFLGCTNSSQTEAYLDGMLSYSGVQRHSRSTFVGNYGRRTTSQPKLEGQQLQNISAVLRHSSLTTLWSGNEAFLTA